MDKSVLRQVVIDQQSSFKKAEELIERELNLTQFLKSGEIIIISGIRRCGKSSLLKLIAKRIQSPYIYLNFDDVRLIDFSVDNFQDIQFIAMELCQTENIVYFLDEIQNVQYWERWVNNLYAQHKKVFVTGSNSSLLSSEISTYLTGRNKIIILFPFSFREYLSFKGIAVKKEISSSEQSVIFSGFMDYLHNGGFPLIVKTRDVELSRQYFEDIVNKDVVNRYKIKQIKEIKDLLLYLFSTTGKTYSYNTLKKITGIKSLSTIKNYIDYFKNVYLLYTIDRFDYSLAKQKVSSSKPFVGDTVFLKTIAFNFTENLGQKFENAVFLELIRKNKQVYYYHEKKECDFVVKEGLKITQAIQVSLNMNHQSTKQREIDGLMSAMKSYKLNEGIILTLEYEEIIKKGEYIILIKPLWKWLLSQ